MSKTTYTTYTPISANDDDVVVDGIAVVSDTTIPPKLHVPNDVDNDADDYDTDDPKLTACGIGSWRPQWLQVFASPLFFMINFAAIGIIQGMTGAYFIGSMSTLEKRFAFDSKISGLILIADNFSQMLVSPIIGYMGTRFNRPRMIASGELVLALSCFITALPYLLYGPGTHLLHDDRLLQSKMMRNETRYELCPANHDDIDCSNGKHSTVWLAVVLLWSGSFLRGLGFTAYFVIGMPYVDDSVSKRNSPIYISLISALRLIGPAGGYLLSSLTLRFYENPFYDPGINRRDPRFIGAWWMGFTLIGICLFFASLPMFLFPKQLKTASVKAKDLKDNVKGMKGTIKAIKRLSSNPILMCQLIGSTIRYIGIGGYVINKVKYIESQYRQSSSSASFITGTISILPMCVGIILGGSGISWIKPRVRNLMIYMFIVELVFNGGIFAGMFMGCPPLELPPYHDMDNKFTMKSRCNADCDCTTSVFTPVCSSDRATTYFSPCYAGCTKMNRDTNTLSQCSCIDGYGQTATAGYCQSDSDKCDKMFPYLIVITVCLLISSTARTGNYLLSFRAVDPKDKSFAMGLMSTFMALFAFIPYPLIFGAITDSACLVWEKTCGKTGNCWLYDQDKFRYYLHGAAFAFMMVGTMFDLGIIFMADKVKDFYDDNANNDNANGKGSLEKGNTINEKQANGANNNNIDTNVIPMKTISTGIVDDDDNKNHVIKFDGD
ncbi:solute carrier organic anion transporter family member 74D-like [Oppia nitens]|uniref:solute carrier organic anion transporter family member 74D-like n=1 Tax=Oppia nitens TaxID=1686743 RepID=UPI0023DAE16F|nr:solute carrier organic anion transporter family member 74D-like [Oppia nitens]